MRMNWIRIVVPICILLGTVGRAHAMKCPDNGMCWRETDTDAAPEIDSSTWVTGLGFTSGAMLVLRARRRNK
jgi:hypothetical protein